MASLVIFSSCSKEELNTTEIDVVEIIETNEIVQTKAVTESVELVTASFTIDNTNSSISEKVNLQLTNNSKNAASYLWDFGNGDTSTEANPVYSYGHHGVFTVKLTVTDRDGNAKEASNDVTVHCLFNNQDHGNS